MHNEFTAIIERDGDWFIAFCPQIPGANGQGATKDEARASLVDAIALILEDRGEDAVRSITEESLDELLPRVTSETSTANETPVPPWAKRCSDRLSRPQ